MPSHTTPLYAEPAALRRRLGKQRRTLSAATQRQVARQVAQRLRTLPCWHTSRHIGVYRSAFGEVDTAPLIRWAKRQGKTVWLPRIRRFDGRLVWHPLTHPHQPMRLAPHRLGMREPRSGPLRQTLQLDMLVMPLVAFDQRGMRLGMGGGFYDRSLQAAPVRPVRVGLGHELQQVARLAAQPWDQGLDYAITASRAYRFKRPR